MLVAILALCLSLAEEQATVSDATRDQNGYRVHRVTSPYQADETLIRVLLPHDFDERASYRVVYVLPVEPGLESKYGSGLDEIKKLNLHNTHRAIFVAPTFAHLPWYGDHPTRPELRQETYFIDVVVRFVDRTYPVLPDAGGRLLLGFSKSGWGAFALLMRHPGMFGKAAAWDAPLMMDKPGKYGSGAVFGTAENFERYRIAKLLEANADQLRDEKRLFVLGYGNFRAEHQAAHAQMDKLHVAHEYRDGPSRKHHWGSGWLCEAVKWLVY